MGTRILTAFFYARGRGKEMYSESCPRPAHSHERSYDIKAAHPARQCVQFSLKTEGKAGLGVEKQSGERCFLFLTG